MDRLGAPEMEAPFQVHLHFYDGPAARHASLRVTLPVRKRDLPCKRTLLRAFCKHVDDGVDSAKLTLVTLAGELVAADARVEEAVRARPTQFIVKLAGSDHPAGSRSPLSAAAASAHEAMRRERAATPEAQLAARAAAEAFLALARARARALGVVQLDPPEAGALDPPRARACLAASCLAAYRDAAQAGYFACDAAGVAACLAERALVLEWCGRAAEALCDAASAFALAPASAVVRYRLASAYASNGFLARAAGDFEQTVALCAAFAGDATRGATTTRGATAESAAKRAEACRAAKLGPCGPAYGTVRRQVLLPRSLLLDGSVKPAHDDVTATHLPPISSAELSAPLALFAADASRPGERRVFFGIGTGRCGTTSLARFMQRYAPMVHCTHESRQARRNRSARRARVAARPNDSDAAAARSPIYVS